MHGILLQSHYFTYWSDHFSLSSSTKKTRIIALKRFEAFLLQEGFEGELNFDQFHASRDCPGRYLPIQRKVIDQFVQYLLHKEQVTDAVLAVSITALKHFFGFLFDLDLIHHNPMMNVPTPKFESPIQNTALSIDECIELLGAALKKEPFYRQEFVLIWFMLITGMRVSEVCSLRRSRLHMDAQIVQVFEGQKTHKRAAAISEALANELIRYTSHPMYLKWDRRGEEFVFHHQGKKMSPERIRKILRDLSKSAGLPRTVRPHDLRRTAGYLMQVGGLNIVETQHQLGQKYLGTTLRYIPPLCDMAKLLEDE